MELKVEGTLSNAADGVPPLFRYANSLLFQQSGNFRFEKVKQPISVVDGACVELTAELVQGMKQNLQQQKMQYLPEF